MPASNRRPSRSAAVLLAIAVSVLAGCTDNVAPGAGPSADPRALGVTASDTACAVTADQAPSGRLRFSVTNTGAKVNEFYVLAADGLRIVAEVENVGPGLSRDLVLTASPGRYFTACKPGMVGEGIRTAFTVADSGADLTTSGDDQALVDQASRSYQSYVRDQTGQLVSRTQAFVAAYEAGDDASARALYPVARTHWERIEPVAESFGDLDPRLDLREADLEQGQQWTGWHRIEKDLWPARAPGYVALTPAQRTTVAARLMADTTTLFERTKTLTYTADRIANGSRGLLDEIARNKVTGEEEHWSRTDLYDFQGNIDGARVGFDGLRPLVAKRDAALDAQIDRRFSALQALLDRQRRGTGFASYDAVSPADVKGLADAVNALSEPLSRLAPVVA